MGDDDQIIPTPFMMPISFGNKPGKIEEPEEDEEEEIEQEEEPVLNLQPAAQTPAAEPEVPSPLEEIIEHESVSQTLRTPFEKIASIQASIQECTRDYFHSAVLAEYTDPITGKKVTYGLRDLTLIGAIVGADVLMTGNTGCGKTMFANRIAIALHGHEHYTEKTCTPGTREADFTDLNFETITKGGKLREAIEAPAVLKNPCVVVNELNRMPEVTQNKLIPYFDKKYEYLGAEFLVGVPTENGLYQFRIVTINEGDKFGGTASIDAAVRDRLIIEIPMDLFPLTREDRYKKRKSHARPSEHIKDNGHTDEIFSLLALSRAIELSKEAEIFLGYLEGLNNCVKSNTQSKMGVDIGYLCQNLCSGCHNIQYDNHICNNVLAPTERALDKLRDIGQGFALLRAYKAHKGQNQGIRQKLGDANEQTVSEFDGLKVEIADIIAAAAFVLFSKVEINPLWVQKHYQGNKWAAVQAVVNITYQRFQKFLDFDRQLVEKYFSNQSLSDSEITKLTDYAVKKDAWAYKIGGK
jgi:hypothetical protein